jgi:hypothetical protein
LSLRVGAKEWPANFSENQAESADRLEERFEVKDSMKAAFVGIMAANYDAGISCTLPPTTGAFSWDFLHSPILSTAGRRTT